MQLSPFMNIYSNDVKVCLVCDCSDEWDIRRLKWT